MREGNQVMLKKKKKEKKKKRRELGPLDIGVL